MNCLVLGAGGFIGSHIVNYLKERGDFVVGADLKMPEFEKTKADIFILRDLSNPHDVINTFSQRIHFDEVYQLAALMGGAGYIFTGQHDADIMTNSALINLNVARYTSVHDVGKLFYSSSACVYNGETQKDTNNTGLKEGMAYPANPDSMYGWEKLFSERLYESYHHNYNLNIRIGRFHNIYGAKGTYKGGKEKAPAALCRKVAEGDNGDAIEVWGNGKYTRSFLYIDDCIEGVMSLMASELTDPVNIGSTESISINDLAQLAINISGKNITIKNIAGPTGVAGRNSDDTLSKEKIGWPKKITPLKVGMEKLYRWVESEVKKGIQ